MKQESPEGAVRGMVLMEELEKNTVCDEYAASLLDAGFPLLGKSLLFDTDIIPWVTSHKFCLVLAYRKGLKRLL